MMEYININLMVMMLEDWMERKLYMTYIHEDYQDKSEQYKI